MLWQGHSVPASRRSDGRWPPRGRSFSEGVAGSRGAIRIGAVAVLVVLALFRFIETRLPSEFYAHHMLRFLRERVMAEDDLRKLIGDHGFTIANLSCRLIEGGQQFEYRMTIKSQDRRNAEKLSVYLRSLPEVVEFRIAPTGD